MANQQELPSPTFPELGAKFNLHYSQVITAINSLMGYRGPISLNDDLDLGGNQIKNMAPPTDDDDAVSSIAAQQSYSASALRPQLESGGEVPLKSVRRINDPNQREQVSSFLNDLMSTPPNANTVYPSITSGGGSATVSIPASIFTFADGSSIQLESRTDSLTLPTSISISSISCTGNVVTVQTSSPSGVTAGGSVTISGVLPPSFNGSFTVASVIDPTHFTYQLDLGSTSGSGGDVELNDVWYYAVYKRQSSLSLLGPFDGDIANNRLQANLDGYAIVAVIVLTASGGNIANSGGGGSPITGSPSAGCFF